MTAVDFSAFVERLAQVSGEVILPFFRSAICAEDKSLGGVFDPVTEADRGAEAAMRRLIAQTFPAHGVIGEEYGLDRPEAEYVWVLDPIDGTKSFVSGLPTWGTLIGLMHHGQPVYGMMAQPFTRERFYGDGKGASSRTLGLSHGDAPPSEWTTRRLHTRACASLAEATLATTSPLLIRDAGRPGGLFAGRKGGSAHALWRRLLRLLRARGRLRRPGDRDQSETPRHRRACRRSSRGRGRGDDLGRGERRQGGADHRRRRPSPL